MTVLLVRHGRTAWNRTRFLGRRDVALDETGTAQAAAAARSVAALLDGAGPVTVWSSPLRRARDTAGPVADLLGSAVRTHPDLVELDCGEWEGREKAEVGSKVSKLPAAQRVPGGESALEVWTRLARFARDAGLRDASGAAVAPDGAVVVVSHHLTGQLLRAVLLGRPADGALGSPEYRPAPGSVVRLDLVTGRCTPVPDVLRATP